MPSTAIPSYYRISLSTSTPHLWKMQTINSPRPLDPHTVAKTGVVKYLTNMLRRAKKEQNDAARNEPLPPLPSSQTTTSPSKAHGSTQPTVTPTEQDDTTEDEYETTESALRWARGEDFTIDGFIRLSQPIDKDSENCSHD
ncbi:hypothetical protein EXIGLDRAFT_767204 [Exidia glandulosa HHB12029]|uniref:Uncharacterized protein n=1 Tax=Exidia glandulosa HHB12029 TaxID=1314781 RepID=A0A165J585_EXIGL|nr:hypothetical protein EXIGLDRAFT_767204 [Exidia glandulosa HHB12029]